MMHVFPRLLLFLFVATVLLSCSDESTAPVTYSVSGTVHQAETGTVIVGADVVATRHDNGQELGRTASDAQGAFLLKGLPAGPLDIRIEAEGFAPVFFPSMDPKRDASSLSRMSVQLVVADSCCSGSLLLTVKNSTGEKLVDKPVVIKKAGQMIADPRTDENGRVRVTDLCPGDYVIRIGIDGYRVYEAVFTINAECGVVELTAVLQGESSGCCDGTLTVTVRDEHNAVVHGAQVRVWKNGAIVHTTFTDANGVAVVTDLCQGKHGVDVLKTGMTPREFLFTIDELCNPVTKDVTMETLGCCSGVFSLILRDATGNPIPGAKVVIKKGGTAIEDPVTNGSGEVVVDGLCRGEYTYRIAKEGYGVVEGSFAINQNCDPVTREAVMQGSGVCCTAVLTVTVTDSTSTPIAGATVKLWRGGAVNETAQTGAQGIAIFEGLCAGEYGVSVLKSGYRTREFTFVIGLDCGPTTKSLVLEP
ncbi:MAG: carboxypeptidase regulatory-like domain-containing protein [Bacteroidota bacterium]|jgi:uncharacterized surface anchored protein|nr:carboxypeptidase regulatory-like domain-containing protein [Bacteroidota bacterium]